MFGPAFSGYRARVAAEGATGWRENESGLLSPLDALAQPEKRQDSDDDDDCADDVDDAVHVVTFRLVEESNRVLRAIH
jgi:hypothetical protein